MDIDRLDSLARSFASVGSRRSLLGLLGAVPVVGGLTGILSPEDATAKDRRRRRKRRHERHKSPGARKSGKEKKKCRPESVAQTCAGTCGSVTNNCKIPVDCGSCDCTPACGECFTCQGTPGVPGTCVPREADTPCGASATCENGTHIPHDRCDGTGQCVGVTPVSCAPYTQCDGDICATSCATDKDCVADSFCNGSGQCVGDLQDGLACTDGGQCASGHCVNGVCCNSACDQTCQACNVSGSVGICSTATNGTSCSGGNVCCAGTCQECCNNTHCSVCQTCDDGACVDIPSLYHTCDGPCPGGEWCDAGVCSSIQDTVRIPDCHSLCGGSTEVCGQVVSCPACDQCRSQTGCHWNYFPDGPLGAGNYCSIGSNTAFCETNADCADDGGYAYCAPTTSRKVCSQTCPF